MIAHLDHLALTLQDIQRTYQSYENMLGIQVIAFATGRKVVVLVSK